MEFDFDTESEPDIEPEINVNADVPLDAAVPVCDPAEFKLCEIIPKPGGNGFFQLRPYQNECVDAVFSDLNDFQSTLMLMATGLGKAQPLDEPVLTPFGFKRMGDVRCGDQLIGRNGAVTHVSGVFPQGKKRIVKVVFSDGSFARCCDEHLWHVYTKSHKCRGKGHFCIKSAEELRDNLVDGSGAAKWFVPVVGVVEYVRRDVPIDPYLFGVLLGDGGLRHQAMFSTDDQFIVDRVTERLPDGYTVKRVKSFDYIIQGGHRGPLGGELHRNLKQLGAKGKYSYEKQIPELYRVNSVDVRLEILRGLMDTDGHVMECDNHTEFNTTSRQLADDVCEIVRSLGGTTRVRTKAPAKYTYKGVKKIGRVSYRVTVSLDGINPFKLPRKADVVRHGKKQGQTKSIISIEDDGFEECQCISVTAGDHLYVTRDFNVTHNTVCLAEAAMRWPDHLGRVLIIAHTTELIDQAAEKVGLHLDELTGIEMGNRREIKRGSLYGESNHPKVLVASIQTLSRKKRLEKLNPKDFGLIIYDEAHHSVSPSARAVITYFLLGNPQIRIVGPTATSQRGDKQALGDLYQSVAYEMDILDGIKEGWLVDIEQKIVVVDGLDFSKCRTTAGDLNQGDLAKVMMGGVKDVQVDTIASGEISVEAPASEYTLEEIQKQEEMIHAVVSPSIVEAAGRQTLVFCVTKSHAERVCEVFRRHPGVFAEFVTDDTPPDERKNIINRFNAAEFQFLVNVAVFTEGFDARVDVIVNAAPTKSVSRYIQKVGRGTRPLKGIVDRYSTAEERREAIANSAKPILTVLDFTGDAGKHNLCSVSDILGGEYSADVIAAAKEKLRNGSTEVVTELLKKTLEEMEEAARQAEEQKKKFIAEQAERSRLAAERAEKERLEREAEHARRRHIKATAQYSTTTVKAVTGITIPETVGVGVEFRGGATDNQVKYLMRLGVSEAAACRFTRGQAGKVIDDLSQKTGGEYRIQFGKYTGRKLSELPTGYIEWAIDNMNNPQLIENIRKMRSESK